MSAAQRLYDRTLAFYDLLCNQEIKRDEKIQKIEEFLDENKLLIDALNEEKNEQDKQLLEEIIKITPNIQKKMLEIQTDIKRDLTRVNNTKKFSNQKPPSSKDGSFFDKTL